VRILLTALLTAAVLLPPTALPVAAASGDRTLHLHYTHTGKSGSFTFRRNGRYDNNVLKQLNVFLADWRTKEPANMDPALFDLLWSVYSEVGARQPIHIVSSYRSPKTNAMLRAKSSGVAENSQHTKGKAIDFFIPGVNLTKLREVAMRHQVGGVGYYPTSGSPFVHLDTGSVRAWPRMTRAQLKQVFPDGRTLHLPTDGKPLSAEGRRYAEAEWKKCRAVPCNGRAPTATTRLASVEAPIPANKPRTLMDMFFGDKQAGEQPSRQQPATVQLASLSEPTQRTVAAIEISAPVPAPPLRAIDGSVATAGPVPYPAQKSPRLLTATRGPLPAATDESALTALAALDAPLPQPRVLMTAYAPEATGGRNPQVDLRQIIESGDAALPAIGGTPDPRLVLDPDNIQTASLGSPPALKDSSDIFDRTLSALHAATAPEPMAAALAELVASRQSNNSITLRAAALVAPELDHVNETLVHPVLVSSQHFAVMTEAEGYLDKATELGPLTGRIGFVAASLPPMAHDHFVSSRPLLVAAR
jgi:uncharacterized protein YcbK (DUF882 family)